MNVKNVTIGDGMTEGGASRTGSKRSTFFLIASSLMTLIVFLGFLPSFYLRPYFRDNGLPLHLIVHGVVMTAWQLLFLTQTILVARRRTDLHRRLGVVSAPAFQRLDIRSVERAEIYREAAVDVPRLAHASPSAFTELHTVADHRAGGRPS